ncbi:AraC family transcriptional regulator CmrA [Opitutaceae bacterium EW11]|nr:AraC family transcriptional regulator CmrA [Opitutaceae bacterium EW11]
MLSELCHLLDRHTDDERPETAVPGLRLFRSSVKTKPSPVVSAPVFCCIAQGRKRVFLGGEPFVYAPTSYLISSADLPVSGEVIEAPYLGFNLAIDAAAVSDLLLSLPPALLSKGPSRALAVGMMDEELTACAVRLVRLLDRPGDIPVLAPLVQREILYRLIQGPCGGMLRELAQPSSQLSQVSRAIQWIRERFDEPIRIEELAAVASMSPPSFHRHFRAITNLSPLQYVKQIRLQEARRRLLADDVDAATVAFAVGYESPSQFSREYRRMFGQPPARDASHRRRRLAALQSDSVPIEAVGA